MHGRRILLVVDRTTLLHLAAETRIAIGGIDTRWELWSPAAPGAVTAALRSTAAGAAAGAPHTAAREESGLTFLALSWSFGFLEALGFLAGVMALVGLLLYLQARQQAREVAYALARRMGLSKSAHGRSVATELTGMLGAAFAAGAAFAWVASRLVLGRLDPLPALPPSPTLRVPVGLLGLTALALAGAALAGAAIVQRRADRVNVAEVMRGAG